MQRTSTPRLLLALVTILLLGAAALAVSGRDLPVFLAINAAGARWLPAFVPSSLTVLGHGLVAVMLLALFLPGTPRVLAAALYAAPLAGALSALGKRLAHTPRPGALLDPAGFHVQGPLLRGSNAFPSGHTITIFLVAAVLILGLERPNEAARTRWLRCAAVLGLALLVGLSRMMVGAHWPSDVLGGAALGIVAGVMGDALARRWRYWQRPGASVIFAILVLGCAAALAVVDTGYPLAVPLQWCAIVLGSAAAVLTLGQRWVKRRGRNGAQTA